MMDMYDMPSREASEKDIKKGLETLTKVKGLVQKTEVKPEVNKESASRLKALGFKTAQKKVSEFAEARMKENMAALAGYTRISWAAFDKLDDELREKTQRTMRLSLESVQDYEGVPPTYVLDELEKAQNAKIFDEFKIISVKRVPDPVLVGCFKGTRDMFFIAEWGDDVSLQDLVA